MPLDPTTLDYRSRPDAVEDDARSLRRSFKTWMVLCAVWILGLASWAVYLLAVAFVLLRVLASF